jgi:hypothetical protein
MFKPNPKAQVVSTFQKLFGRERKAVVQGRRLDAAQCKSLGLPRDSYRTELVVDGAVVAAARSVDWRKSYKLLKIEVEKLYADGGLIG